MHGKEAGSRGRRRWRRCRNRTRSPAGRSRSSRTVDLQGQESEEGEKGGAKQKAAEATLHRRFRWQRLRYHNALALLSLPKPSDVAVSTPAVLIVGTSLVDGDCGHVDCLVGDDQALHPQSITLPIPSRTPTTLGAPRQAYTSRPPCRFRQKMLRRLRWPWGVLRCRSGP